MAVDEAGPGHGLSSSASTPLNGPVPPVSPMSRSASASPRKKVAKQPLHIRMNLTENQVNKLTDAFTSQRGRSPVKSHRLSNPTPSTPKRASLTKSVRMRANSLASHTDTPSLEDQEAAGELMPGWVRQGRQPQGLAGRRKGTPRPIDVQSTAKGSRYSRKPKLQEPVELISPLHCHYSSVWPSANLEDADNDFRQYDVPSQVPGPLRMYDHTNASHRQNSSLGCSCSLSRERQRCDVHGETSDARGGNNTSSPQRKHRELHRAHHGGWTGEAINAGAQVAFAHLPQNNQNAATIESPIFSPLALYFRVSDFPAEKKRAKVMIGDDGWLERKKTLQPVAQRPPVKKNGILDGIKRIAKDMSELHHSKYANENAPKAEVSRCLSVSLDSREQSLLYCELEYHLTNALNTYIVSQLDRGTLVAYKLQRIAETWTSQGRPRVVGFRYDLETQISLIALHVEDFIFHGKRAGKSTEISALLKTMKADARAMAIRTFCQPDKVIAKHLVDAQSLFNLLGVNKSQNDALDEVARFFRLNMERAKHTSAQQTEELFQK